MLRCFIYSVTVISVMWHPLHAQIDLHFNLKEAIDLPGNAIFDLAIQDVNNDNFPDYSYRDSNSVYIIDGFDLSIISNFPFEPGTELLRLGDLNNDGIKDLALCGTYTNNPDTNFVLFLLGPSFYIEHRLEFPTVYEFWIETNSEIYFTNVFGLNLILLGTHLNIEYANYPIFSHRNEGRLKIYTFSNEIISEQESIYIGGVVKQILPFYNELSSYFILKTWGDDHWESDRDIYSNTWTDIFSLDNSLDTANIWHFYGTGGLDAIPNIIIDKPHEQEDDLIFFINLQQTGSLVCMDDPFGNIAWEKPGYDCHFCTYNITLSDVLNREFEDLLIFRSDWLDFIQIRNPYDGYLDEIGALFGHIGDYFCTLDQDNDGIDEFFYIYSGFLYIFNLQNQTVSDSEDNDIPAEPRLSIAAVYPNPFNSRTTIEFELSEPARATVDIYDLLGRHILILADQNYQSGNNRAIWDAREINSGVYFVKVSTSEVSKTSKMILIK